MARIYISSTYKDLKNEREAAAKAVRRLHHQSVYMEDYVAESQLPVEKCLQDVRGCDAYVGIFAWRYGFIPGGHDKSITHLEYETAKEAGIPRLIFLLEEDAPWPVNQTTTGEERQKIDRLRRELMNEYLVSFFKNTGELSTFVTAAVSNLKFPGQISDNDHQDKPKLGPYVHKKCDRNTQVNDFMIYFREKLQQCPKRPQFYFIHGPDDEGHDSWLDRLMNIDLSDYALRKWGKEKSAICLHKVSWPVKGSLPDRQMHLKMELMRAFHCSHEGTDFNVNILRCLPDFDKLPLVLIKHNIYSNKWDEIMLPLISWYIKDFWGAFTCAEYEEPLLFLVFLNVIYQKSKAGNFMQKIWKGKSSTRERIRQQLNRLAQAADEKCPCKLITELESIAPEEVDDWVSTNNIVPQEWIRKELIDYVFNEDGRRFNSICWLKLEQKLLNLSTFIEKCQFQNQHQHYF